MIKEFWQERREEKRKAKELRKQNRKTPKSREQRAYKIFGVLLALFLIFGSLFYTCRGMDNIDDYSWESLIGVTDDMKIILSEKVDKSELISNKELSVIDWSECRDVIISSGLDIITDSEIDGEKMMGDDCILPSTLSLKDNLAGALVSELIRLGSDSQDVQLIEFIIYQDGVQSMLQTLMNIDLSATVIGSTLPRVYITSVSRIEILNNKLSCLDTTLTINKLNEEKNAEILEILNRNSLIGLDKYTNDLVVGYINDFAECVRATPDISGVTIKIMPK